MISALNVPHANFERDALDRNFWSYLCQSGNITFEISRIDRPRDERQRRKTSTTIPVSMSREPRRCTICGVLYTLLAGRKCHIQQKHK